MTRPLGNCPGCGGDEPFEQVHVNGECPDTDGDCPEWACSACGAGVFMGGARVSMGVMTDAAPTPDRQPARVA